MVVLGTIQGYGRGVISLKNAKGQHHLVVNSILVPVCANLRLLFLKIYVSNFHAINCQFLKFFYVIWEIQTLQFILSVCIFQPKLKQALRLKIGHGDQFGVHKDEVLYDSSTFVFSDVYQYQWSTCTTLGCNQCNIKVAPET